MKRMEVVLSIFLIAAGLICLTMSGSLMFEQGLTVYLRTFIQVCLWMAIPIILIGVFFLWNRKKRR
ncbi:hypothetical protein [Bacillus sp. J33]|uniref:hypothetical protein n=1 Tax=Bacillus sp. J33 TaxID=935836 RepID=UPI00047EA06B|nr:hypothetical protein [Bacillus sp. J33]